MDEKKIVLVTGASRGIGKAILRDIALSQSSHVIGTATSSKGVDAINKQIKEVDGEGGGLEWNALCEESQDSLLETIKEKYGRLPDVLVNNAGITRDNLILRMKKNEWNDVIQANLTSAYKLSQACVKSMIRKRWGRIINISSIVGRIGNAGQANYAAAKSGLIGFSKSLAAEIASREVTVNCICPGYIETDMMDFLSPDQKQQVINKIPMRRLGRTDEIAHAVQFLMSEKSGYITGTCLDINGGLVML